MKVRRISLAGLLVAATVLTTGIGCAKPINGTPANDRLAGSSEADQIYGGRGEDVIRGLGGADSINGGPDGDRIYGGAGDDELFGGGCEVAEFGHFCDNPGREHIYGGRGNDVLLANPCVHTFCAAERYIALNSFFYGGPGDDRIVGADHRDVIKGGPGNDAMKGLRGRDKIMAAGDGRKDRVICGPGRDRAIVDPFDRTRGCERVTR